MIKFVPLGGAGEIGANCYYLNIEGTGILLDCGMHPQKKGLDALPDFDLIEDSPVDFVLISHATWIISVHSPILYKGTPTLELFQPHKRGL